MKDRSTEEKRHHSNARVPYTCYKGIIPDWFPSVPLHWHREFELAYIYDGKGIFRIEEQIIPVVIIKPGALHSTDKTDCKKFDYDTIVFDDSFLFGNHAERCFTDLLSIFEREDSFIRLPINSENMYYEEIRENTLKTKYPTNSSTPNTDRARSAADIFSNRYSSGARPITLK